MDPLPPDDPCDDMSADIPARVVIIPDTAAENRRGEGDGLLSTILHWHRRYDLGGGPRDRRVTEAEIGTLRAGGIAALRAALDAAGEDVRILLPLGLLDHSGLHLWIGGGAHWSDAGRRERGGGGGGS